VSKASQKLSFCHKEFLDCNWTHWLAVAPANKWSISSRGFQCQSSAVCSAPSIMKSWLLKHM